MFSNFFKILLIAVLFLVFSCQNNKNSNKDSQDLPKWYISPKDNDSQSLYGVGEGYSLEEATKAALGDAAGRLIISISSESNLLREENQNSTNEEIRQQIKQNVEKIDFVGFRVSNSKKIGPKLYAEIEIERDPFIAAQKEKMLFLDRQIIDIEKNISKQNVIQKRNSLIQTLDLAKQSEILARILQSNGEKSHLQEKLNIIANAQNQLNKMTDKIEFFIISDSSDIKSAISTALNRERIKISPMQKNSPEQIVINIISKVKTGNVYGSYITKINIEFQNKSADKIIASNLIEVSGSSIISDKESYMAAAEALKDKISKDGILKILGIIQ